MTYKVAGSLLRLRDQLDTACPKRSRLSDGTIGDSAHASRKSDHNPWYNHSGQAYVTAIDITHDPTNGMDCEQLSDRLWASRDPRLKYLIWQGQIMAGNDGPSPWYYRAYKGSNPHNKHLHLSVRADPASLIQADWNLEGTRMAPPVIDPALFWGFPVHDLYTTKPDDTMAAGVALEWAVRHAALAHEAAEAALRTAQRIEVAVHELLNRDQAEARPFLPPTGTIGGKP